jgi:hypothetical protein
VYYHLLVLGIAAHCGIDDSAGPPALFCLNGNCAPRE